MNSDGALTTTTVDLDSVNKRGYNVIVINDATGMKVDDTVNCSAIPYAIQEGTTIKYIQDIDSSKVSASKMVVLSTNLMKDLPGGTGIQASIDQPTLAPNAKLAAVGEKIQLKTSGGRVIEYLSPVTNKTIDMFTIVASYESPSNPQKWILKIAETLTTTDIDNLKRACVAVSKFDITAINKGSAWKFGTVYAVGARVTDTNGVCWSATLAHTAGIDNAPGNPEYWTAGNYTMTIAATPDCQPTAWAEYVKKYDGTSASTPAERVSYPNVGDGTLVSIVNKSMNVPLHLDTGTVATFLNYSLK
jgi:hypothetical protein